MEDHPMILIPGHAINAELSFCSRLTVQDHIASGRYGDVYKTLDPDSSRAYALKHIRFGKNKKNAGDIDAVIAETVKSAFRIGNELFLHPDSPYVVKNYGLVRLDALEFALIFEYVEGEELDEWLHNRPQLPWPEKENLFLKILEGAAAIHQKNIIHHDLKPQNILVDALQNPRILDFGLSTLIDKDFTSTRDYKGTPTYIAPENFIGRKTTIQFDIYSLGCILYHMYRGKSYLDVCGFEAPPLERMIGGDGLAAHNILDLDPAFPNASPQDKRIANAIRRATGFNPAYRYPDISSFVKDLRPNYKPLPIPTVPGPPAPPPPKLKIPAAPPPKLKIVTVPDTRNKRYKILFYIILILLLAAVGVLVLVMDQNRSLQENLRNVEPFRNKFTQKSKQNASLKSKLDQLGKTIKKKNKMIKQFRFNVGKQPFDGPVLFSDGLKQFFYVSNPVRVDSMVVYPDQDGKIFINLYDTKGNFISRSPMISLEERQWQRVKVNLKLKPGRYYFSFYGTCDLAYSMANNFYTYDAKNLITITGAHSDPDYNYHQDLYAYFHEWKVSPIID
jgi:serine/threonine protein kinase